VYVRLRGPPLAFRTSALGFDKNKKRQRDAHRGTAPIQNALRLPNPGPGAAPHVDNESGCGSDSIPGMLVRAGRKGAIIGHEITHGFDDQGSKFDAAGALRDWWAPVGAHVGAARCAITPCASMCPRTCTRPRRFESSAPVRNIDAWYSAFAVQPTDRLYLRPEERVRIW